MIKAAYNFTDAAYLHLDADDQYYYVDIEFKDSKNTFTEKDFINEMVKWRQGVIYGQWRIHEDDFLKIEVLVPSVPEQEKIGRFLRSLDDRIALQQRELEKLQSIKKALLEKMFV